MYLTGKKSSDKKKNKNAVTAETSTSNGTTSTDKKSNLSDKKKKTALPEKNDKKKSSTLPDKNAMTLDIKPATTAPTNVTAGTKVIQPGTSNTATAATPNGK